MSEEDEVVTAADIEAFMSEEEKRFAGLNDSICTYSEVWLELIILLYLKTSRAISVKKSFHVLRVIMKRMNLLGFVSLAVKSATMVTNW